MENETDATSPKLLSECLPLFPAAGAKHLYHTAHMHSHTHTTQLSDTQGHNRKSRALLVQSTDGLDFVCVLIHVMLISQGLSNVKSLAKSLRIFYIKL